MASWKCPKCNREFEKKGQQHSCTPYPLEKHFKGKEQIAKPLYNAFIKKIESGIGKVKIESLPCCIHLVADYAPYTFGCVYALKDGIRIHFASETEIKSNRIQKFAKTSSTKFLNSLDIKSTKEMDKELMGWIKEAYEMKKKQ